MNKFLMAHDMSPNAKQALIVGAAWSKNFSYDLQVIHIHPDREELLNLGMDATFGDSIDERLKAMSQIRKELLKNEFQKNGLDIDQLQVLRGNPWKTIVQECQDDQYKLVILGMSGATFWREMLIGSVVQRVAEHGPKSLLAVHQKSNPIPQKILFACDFESDSAPALKWCKKLQEKFKCHVELYCDVNPERVVGQTATAQKLNTLSHMDSALEQLRANSELELSRLADTFPHPDLVSNMCQSSKEIQPDRSIIEAAKKISADLIVVGTHSHHGPKRWLMGSVAERVLKTAPCSVLLAREFSIQ